MKKVVISNKVHTEVIELLEKNFEVISNQNDKPLTYEKLKFLCKDANGVMVFMPDRIDKNFLDNSTNLEIISGALRGFDNIDLEECIKRNIKFTMIPDLLASPTAELTLGLLIGLSRNLLIGDEYVRSEKFKGWEPKFFSNGIEGKNVCLLGMGKLGVEVARKIKGFNVKLFYHDLQKLDSIDEQQLNTKYLELNDLFEKADYLVILLPLKNDTYHFINFENILKIKKNCLLINTSRGSVVDESAIAQAINSGHIGGYASDVFEFEDLSIKDRPKKINQELLNLKDKTFFTPHLGSAVDEVRLFIELEAAQNIINFLYH